MDPFPNSEDATLEKRLQALFKDSKTILVVPTDPLERRDGLLWLNTTSKKVKIYSGGVTWIIGEASVES